MKKNIAILIFLLAFNTSRSQELKSLENIELKNLLSFNLITVTNIGVLSGPGIGFCYERQLGESKKLGIHIPLNIYFKDADRRISRRDYNENGFFAIAPTLKIYPFGYDRNVSWSVGPGLRIASGKVKNGPYNVGIANRKYEVKDYFATEIHNGLNINIERFYFNIASAIGIAFNYTDIPTTTLDIGLGFKL